MSDDNVSLGLVHEVEVMLRKFGADREFWKKISQNENVAKEVINSVGNTPIICNVIIDYGRSLDEMVKATQHENNVGVGTHFTLDNRKKAGRKGKYETQIAVFDFRYKFGRELVGAQTIIDELNKLGYRPANIMELLAFGEYFYNLQKERGIVALDAGCNCGVRTYLTLNGKTLSQLSNGSFRYFNFAAVRK